MNYVNGLSRLRWALAVPALVCLADLPVRPALTKSEYSVLFCRAFGVEGVEENHPTYFRDLENDKNRRFFVRMEQAAAVPDAHFDGKQWYAQPEEEVTSEMVLSSCVIWSGIPLVSEQRITQILHSHQAERQAEQFSLRGRVYLSTLLDLGLHADRIPANVVLSEAEAESLLKTITGFLKGVSKKKIEPLPPKTITNVEASEAQGYFQDGPMFEQLTIRTIVPQGAQFHQYTSLKAEVSAYSTATNAVGLWAAANANTEGARVWGGFLTAVSPVGPEKDSQLVGLEIDLINRARPGIFPFQSKVGIQLVSIGDADSSAALEVISDKRSRWKNGMLISDDALAPDAAVIGLSQSQPIRTGIDFSQGVFRDAAIRINNNQSLRFDGSKSAAGERLAALIRNSGANVMTIVMGENGLVVRDARDQHTVLSVRSSGGRAEVEVEQADLVLRSKQGKRFKLIVGEDGELSSEPIQ